MDKIVISGVSTSYNGDHPLDLEGEPLTTLEWRWIKKISGYMPLTMADGFAGADPDLVIALAVVALRRNGRVQKEQVLAMADRLADLPFDGTAIQLVIGEDEEQPVEGDDVPPTRARAKR